MAPQREWFEKDYYAVLGVPSGATDKEISARLQEARQEAPPRRQPRRRRGRGALQGGERPRTTCSANATSARSTTRSGAWSPPASVRAASAAVVGAASARRRSTTGGGLGDLLGDCSAADGASAVGAARTAARRISRPSCTSRSTTGARRHEHGAVPRRRDRARRARSGGRAGTRPRRARVRRGGRSRSTKARSRSRRCARRAAGAAGHPDAVPDVPRPRRRGARAR